MKKNMILLLAVLFLFASMPVFSAPTDEDIILAFGLSFQAYIASSFVAAFGGSTPGVTLTETTMNFDNVDILSMNLDNAGNYKTMSGKIVKVNDNDVSAELKFTGGKIKNLEWTIKDFNGENENNVFTIKADGRNFTYNTAEM